jgi:RNA polymerase sigma-70 factor (ECF subfamily)
MEGWTHPEIGARFGRSQSWSKSILARSLAHLREYLEEQGSEHS